MRLHSLSLTAFGPFPKTETIAFDTFDASGILLIHGPTGSGKTSLLDAVTFALFGEVPGARRGLRHALRSDHAAEGVAPRVVLEFSVGTQRFRIDRSPSWEAPKRRGQGTTARNASVLLLRQEGDEWLTVTNRIPEAASQITELLGMKIDQFSQVVLLPQGEFAQFLRAKPEERATLLQRLFDVSRFEHIEAWLAKQRQEARGTLDALQARMLTATSTFASAAQALAQRCETDGVAPLTLPRADANQPDGSSEPDDSDEPGDTPDADAVTEPAEPYPFEQLPQLPAEVIVERMSDLLAQFTHRHDEVADAAARAKTAVAQAAQAHRSAESIVLAQEKYAGALAVLAETSEQDVADLGERIQRAQAASAVLLAHRRSETAQEDVTSAQQQLVECESRLRTTYDGELPDDAWVESTSSQLARLEWAHELTSQFRSQIRKTQRARDAITQAEGAVEQATTARDDAAEKLTAAIEELQQAEQATDNATAPDDFAAALRQLRTADQTVRDAEVALRSADDRVQRTTSDELAAERASAALHQRHMSNLAAVLASELHDDEPCPVCGSREHPAPANAESEAVSDAELEQAEADVRAARQARTAAGNEQARRQQDVQNAQQIQADQRTAVAQFTDRPDAELEAHERQLRAAYDTLQAQRTAAERQRDAAQRAMTDAEKALAQAVTVQERAQARQQEAAEEVATSRQRLDDHLTALPRLVSPDAALTDDALAAHLTPLIPQRITEVRQLLDQGREYVTQQRHLTQVQTALQQAQEAVREQLAQSSFATVAEAHASALSRDELAARQQRWAQLNKSVTSALSTLEDQSIQLAQYVPAPNVSDLARRSNAAAVRSDAAAEANTVWASSRRALVDHEEAVHQVVDEMGPATQAAQEISDLADTVTGTGDNDRKMRLTSYVLAAYLETITDYANDRLSKMGQGRYQLQYSDDRVKGNAKSGLGLKVVDLWTGRTRDTASLSGGEAFMASLALALGLGDAVRSQAGGLELHTLFVDEGFGTLDPETLEEVMQVLDELREGGRLVGIVSHVSELKDRIPSRLEVVKTSKGSTVQKLDGCCAS